jgi:uncharacterized damage-inducible protein DinB
MKQYLIDYFKFNDWANRKLINAIKELPDKEKCLYYFSHLITCHNKWINVFLKEWEDKGTPWFGDIYPPEELESRWSACINKWLNFLESKTEEDIEKPAIFESYQTKKKYEISIRKIAFQLNCHSIHHRGQMVMIIRDMGITPPGTDYIYMVSKEVK